MPWASRSATIASQSRVSRVSGAREQGHHPYQPLLNQQGVAGKGHHALRVVPIPGPRCVRHGTRHWSGEAALPGDEADLELADGNPSVGSIQMHVQAGAGLQYQGGAGLVEGPDAGESGIEMADEGLRAALEGGAGRRPGRDWP